MDKLVFDNNLSQDEKFLYYDFNARYYEQQGNYNEALKYYQKGL